MKHFTAFVLVSALAGLLVRHNHLFAGTAMRAVTLALALFFAAPCQAYQISTTWGGGQGFIGGSTPNGQFAGILAVGTSTANFSTAWEFSVPNFTVDTEYSLDEPLADQLGFDWALAEQLIVAGPIGELRMFSSRPLSSFSSIAPIGGVFPLGNDRFNVFHSVDHYALNVIRFSTGGATSYNWALAKRVFKISLDRYLASKH
jgi:hypothetical protein